MPVVSRSSGSVRISRPVAAREERGEDALELPLHVGEGGGEHVVDPLVDLADDGEQVAPGGLEVLELGGQEAVPLLQRRELLQRQRVDLAEGGEVALGLGRPPLLDGAVVGHRVRLGLPRRLGGGDLLRRRRDRRGGPVLGEEGGQVDAVLLGRAALQRLDAVPLLGAGDLVAVHLVGQPVEVGGGRADAGAHLEQLGLRASCGRTPARPAPRPPARARSRARRAPSPRRRARRRPRRLPAPARPGRRPPARGRRAPGGPGGAATRPGRAGRGRVPRRCGRRAAPRSRPGGRRRPRRAAGRAPRWRAPPPSARPRRRPAAARARPAVACACSRSPARPGPAPRRAARPRPPPTGRPPRARPARPRPRSGTDPQACRAASAASTSAERARAASRAAASSSASAAARVGAASQLGAPPRRPARARPGWTAPRSARRRPSRRRRGRRRR